MPINRLSSDAQARLWKAAAVTSVGVGQVLFVRGASDEQVHFLLSGELELVDQGRMVVRLSPTQRIARRPLDAPGPKRYTARAHTPCTVVTLQRREYEREVETSRPYDAVPELAAMELVETPQGDWMTRLMESALFRVLPSSTIQAIFGALSPVDFAAGELVLSQGDAGDHFYVLEHGYCEVTRRAGGGRPDIHVADVRPGDSFGEAAVISNQPRDASVVALTDGRALRLTQGDFTRWVAAPLLKPVTADVALQMTGQRARWLDISDPEVYAKAPLRNSRNIPLNALRAQAARLARDEAYIVCGDEPSQAAVGAFVLAERGFNVYYLDAPIVVMLSAESRFAEGAESRAANVVSFPTTAGVSTGTTIRETEMDNAQNPAAPNRDVIPERTDRLFTQQEFEAAVRKSAAPLPVSYAETHTGQTLARLIEDIDAKHDALGQEADNDSADFTQAVGFDDTQTDFIDLGALEATTSSLREAPPVAELAPPAPMPPIDTGDPVGEMMHDFELRLRNYVEANLVERTLEVERRYQAKVQKLQQQAQAALRKRDTELRQRYAAHFQKKDQSLRENYQKLMQLATKISQQKAQLQTARAQFEEKIKAANAVYRQVEDMRRLLGEQLSPIDTSGSRSSSR